MVEADERAWLARSIDAVAQATGSRPQGYASQDYGYSSRTPALLEEAGIGYAVDWPNDERPFLFGPRRQIVMLPPAVDLDDAHAMIARKVQPRLWGGMLDAALEHWSGHALEGSVLAIPLHAWIAGAAHRSAVLRRTLLRHDANRFWQAGPDAIAATWRTMQPVT